MISPQSGILPSWYKKNGEKKKFFQFVLTCKIILGNKCDYVFHFSFAIVAFTILKATNFLGF